MSYARALGYDVEIDTPIGVQTVSFDLDKVARDASQAFLSETWPVVEQRTTTLIQRERDAALALADERVAEIKRGMLLFVAAIGATFVTARWLGGRRHAVRSAR